MAKAVVLYQGSLFQHARPTRDLPLNIRYQDQGRDYESVMRGAGTSDRDRPSNLQYKDQGRDYQSVLRGSRDSLVAYVYHAVTFSYAA